MTDHSPSAPPAATSDRLTETQAAELLAVCPRTLQRWRRSGFGPAWHRHGMRRVFYLRSDLDAWAAAQRQGGDGPAL